MAEEIPFILPQKENWRLTVFPARASARYSSHERRIVGQDRENKLRLLLSYADGGDIADPWYCGNFDRTYEDIVRGCEGFLRYLGYEK